MKRVSTAFLLAAIGMSQQYVDAFTVPQPSRLYPTTTTRLYNSQKKQKVAYFVDEKVDAQKESDSPPTAKQDADDEQLSDLDARVLKSMLQDDKLDLQQEANMKKLLERGVAPKSAPSFEKKSKEEDDSEFSSQLFKTLADTKLWKGLKRDAGNILESVGIFVANRMERDAKLLASVGLFAWERAVRDVGRALPASGTSGAAVGRAVRQAARQLSNSSSYQEIQEKRKSLEEMDNLYEELNTPMDEIKSVTQSIRDILKGESVTSASSGRSLRSVAPAGQSSNAERQKRAYRRRKISTLKQEKEVINLRRAAGGVIDTAAEVRRELQVESSTPGYRTEGARKAIAAGAAETQRFLAAAKRDGWSKALFAPNKETKEDNIRELVGSEDIETVKVEVDAQAVSQLMEEQARIIERLDLAIHDPGETWLTTEVVSQLDGTIDEDALREVVTAMVLARDEWEGANFDESLSPAEMVEKLRQVKSTVDSITSLAAACAGMAGAECLSKTLYGQDEEGADSRPSLLTLDEVGPSIAAAVEVAESLPVVETKPYSVDGEVMDKSEAVERTVFAEVVSGGRDRISTVDVMPTEAKAAVNEVYITDFDKQVIDSSGDGAAFDPNIRMASAEVISDDDFDSAVGAKRVAVATEGEVEEAKEEPNVLVFFLLRSLDVFVLVIEKLFTTVLPSAVSIGSTASTRLADVAREGMGTKGWKTLGNAQSGSKRY